MRFKALVLVALSVATMLLVAACGGPPPPTPPRDIPVSAGDFFFAPSEFTLKAGEKVRFLVTNDGAVDHTFHVLLDGEEQGIDVPVGAGNVPFEFSAPQAGTYEVICVVPGHKELGMVASLVVE
ncbi:MAG: hypothetical protein HYZ68_03475 [Chloroflexi bacterium]|nr:hypothetical protein [Chloroflexota bacterium]